MAATLYAGPGKLYFGGLGIFPEGENGMIKADIMQESDPLISGYHGRLAEQQANAEAMITVTPIDRWSYLPVCFPAWLGAKHGNTAAALAIGTRPHGAANAAAKIWTPDGRLYNFVRGGLIKPPELNLGVGQALFGEMGVGCIGDSAKALGDASFLYTITESAAADPGGQMDMADFVRGRWTGVYGTVAGFGGGENATPMEAEEKWTVSCEAKFAPLAVQKLVRAYQLMSVGFMVKARLYGPTHTQIDAAIGINAGRTLGSRFGTASDLVLSGPGGKTITLKNADVKGAGFEFGGTKLGTGEVGFVNYMTFTAGAPGALIEFSA